MPSVGKFRGFKHLRPLATARGEKDGLGVDSVRYYLALILIVSVPPAFLVWFVIHPFARFWRRVPTIFAYLVVLATVTPVGVVVYLARDRLLRVEFGFSWVLSTLAMALYLLAAVIELRCRRYLKLSILVGLPELSSKPEASVLLDEGIYGRIRHPRYVDIVLGVLAVALFTNYLAVYVMWVLALPVIWLLTVIEERELLGRFGERYADYRLRVPRFIPRPQDK